MRSGGDDDFSITAALTVQYTTVKLLQNKQQVYINTVSFL